MVSDRVVRVTRLVLILVVAFGCQALAQAQWTGITTPTCAINSTSLNPNSQVLANCSYGNAEFFVSVSFYATARCQTACSSSPISHSFAINVGQNNGPCNFPVIYSFTEYTGSLSYTNNPTVSIPFLGVSVFATSDAAAAHVDTYKDCNGIVTTDGLDEYIEYRMLPC